MPWLDPAKRSMAIMPSALVVAASPAMALPSPQAAFEAYRDLINRHDFELLAETVMGPHPVFVFADKRHDGLDAVRAAFRQTWIVLPDETYSMTHERWLFSDDEHAACTFIYTYRGTMADGRALSGGGQGVNLFQRTDNGWRLVFEQLTPDTSRADK